MVDLESLTLSEAIRLQGELSALIASKYERHLALVFSDIVGSTSYFTRFGNEAGLAMQQRHFEQMQTVLQAHSGRFVDKAGDGAFVCFPRAEAAVTSMMQMQQSISEDNFRRPRDHQLSVRIGIHWGTVLTDDVIVRGDAVNLASRVSSTCQPGEIRLTRPAFLELPNTLRVRCRYIEPVELKGIANRVPLMELIWWDRSRFPELVQIENTAEKIPLPPLDTISFGRLSELDGIKANDVVIRLPEERLNNLVSRWHFELRRRPDGFVLRTVSNQLTEVDGKIVAKGEEAAVRDGTTVTLAKYIKLKFVSAPTPEDGPRVTSIIG